MPLARAAKADADTKVPLHAPPRRAVPIDPRTGLFTPAWLMWLELSYRRQGEAHAPSNAELDEGLTGTQGDLSGTQEDLAGTQASLEQTQSDLTALTTRVTTVEGEVDTLQTDVTALTTRVTTLETALSALTTRVTTLETTVADHETRLDALEAWKVALVAALPAVVSVATIPALTNDPATSILLENDLTANWRPPVNANDVALQTAVNAVRNALAA